jgi:hypothetical protein
MAINHTFTTDLDVAFVPFEKWLEEKHGAEKTALLVEAHNTDPDFSNQYNAWLVDQKITHTIEAEGTEPVVNTYKDLV